MSPFAGPFFAAAALLGLAGALKLSRPASTRVALRTAGLPAAPWVARGLGAGELVLAVGAIAVGGPVAAGLVAAGYVGFAAFAFRLDRVSRHAAPCGCFGASDAPVGTLHVVVNLVVAVLLGAAVVRPTDGIASVVAESPLAGVPFVGLTLLLSWLLLVALTALPELLAAQKPGADPVAS